MPSTFAAELICLVAHAESGYETFDVLEHEKMLIIIHQKSFLFLYPDFF